ncbi:hypothetical protein [Virgibacillus litoralis]|uniref:Uncharacterized protein n=1 Tax=Virgibacillus litoralis TaxID=578221 RepID=A0ABS4HEY2_9BACI|nr:hypothetical protein [Virgibacillus litoralis]MBP1949428.1 hypothetical protein [Virgibacillus litoralis]
MKINPLTYSVDMFKEIILQRETMSAPLRQAMGLDLKIFDHIITSTEEVVVVRGYWCYFCCVCHHEFLKAES